MTNKLIKAVNWNNIEDQVDKLTYEKLVNQQWLSTRIPLSKDKKDWDKLSQDEKTMIENVFGGLTSLDTLQSEDGIQAIRSSSVTQHELAVLNQIQWMESEHARSYSAIFSTLNTPREIKRIFDWVENNDVLQEKANMINKVYEEGNDLQKKVASVFLEGFAFYSGFYTPLWYLGNGQLINCAEIIRLIIKDESVHSTYISYKFMVGYKKLPEFEKLELKNWVYQFLLEIYENEVKYAQDLYDKVGWTEEVKTFMRYNANKSLMNLGFDPLFPDTSEDVNPIVMNGLSTTTTNNDFFSATTGNGYLLLPVEEMKNEDYDY